MERGPVKRRKNKYARRRRILYIVIAVLFLVPASIFAKNLLVKPKGNGNAEMSYTVSGNVNDKDNQKTALSKGNSATAKPQEETASAQGEETAKVQGDNPYNLVEGSSHSKEADRYAYSTQQVRKWMRHEEPYTGGKLVFLTFDDGPNNTITPKVLDALKANGAHGTFFVVGKNITEKTAPMIVREIQEGHAVASHSLTHNYKALYPKRVANANEILYEVDKTETIIQGVLGKTYKSSVFRYPGGHMSWKQMAPTDEALSKRGTHWMDWNTSIGDAVKGGSKAPPETLLANVKAGVAANKNGNLIVLLMHDEGSKHGTAAALPSVIQYFKNEGYQFGILK